MQRRPPHPPEQWQEAPHSPASLFPAPAQSCSCPAKCVPHEQQPCPLCPPWLSQGSPCPHQMVLGEQPQSPLPAPLPHSPPGLSPLSGRGARGILNQNCQVPSGFSGPSPRHQAVTSLGCWQCLEKGTYCQGAFLTHLDLWPSLKPKNPPYLHGHFWKRCRRLISCAQGFPGSEPCCDSVAATSSLRTGLCPPSVPGCGVCDVLQGWQWDGAGAGAGGCVSPPDTALPRGEQPVSRRIGFGGTFAITQHAVAPRAGWWPAGVR